MALAAAVWLPALAETHFTRYSEAIASSDVHYSHFFGTVLAWPEPALAGVANPPLPLTVGAGQLLLGCLVLALVLTRLASKRLSGQSVGVAWVSVALSLTGLGAVYLGTPLSSWAWENSGSYRISSSLSAGSTLQRCCWPSVRAGWSGRIQAEPGGEPSSSG